METTTVKSEYLQAMQVIGANAKEDAKAKYPEMDFGKVEIGGKFATVWTSDEKQAVSIRLRY